MAKNKLKRREKNDSAHPDQNGGGQDKNIDGNMHVRGEIEVRRSPSLEKEHAAERTQDNAQQDKTYRLERYGLWAVIIYALITLWQGFSANKSATAARDAANAAQGSLVLARQGLHLDQRAWISVVIPSSFPLNGKSIPAIIQMTNTGKTPATGVQGDIVATILTKGLRPAFGDYSIGHPHNKLYAAAVFPNAPVLSTILIAQYGPTSEQYIIPDDSLRKDIANGDRFIVFYGEITYNDVFGIKHWTHFCTTNAAAILDNLKECISYNSVDNNE